MPRARFIVTIMVCTQASASMLCQLQAILILLCLPFSLSNPDPGERMTYASAEDICIENGLELGHPGVFKETRAGICADGMKNRLFRSWSNASCDVQVKIAFASGES